MAELFTEDRFTVGPSASLMPLSFLPTRLIEASDSKICYIDTVVMTSKAGGTVSHLRIGM